MELFGKPQLETHDLGEALEFVCMRNRGWMDVVFGPILIGIFAYFEWREHSILVLVFAVVGVIGLLANRARGHATVLRVSQLEIVARGNLDGHSGTEMTIPRADITSMGWNAGGQDDSGGLFVSRGWVRSYVLPGATEAQAREIIATITGKFPGFPIDDKTWASLIWGDESVLLTLELDEAGQQEESTGS